MSSARATYSAVVALVLSAAALATVLLAGGQASAAGNVTWTYAPNMPFKSHEASGIGAAGRLFVFGGYDDAKIKQNQWAPRAGAASYDVASGTWKTLEPLPAFAAGSAPGVSHAGAATDGSTAIFLAGGYPANADGTSQKFGSTTVLRYDIAADRYDALPSLPAARGAGGLVYLDGVLHFMGGSNSSRATVGDHWALDLSKLSAGWVRKANLPSPRNHLAVALVGQRILVAGGQVGEDAAAVNSDRLESYNPETDKWHAEVPLPKVLSHLAMVNNHGLLVILGGESTYNVATSTNYAYDPATETWSTVSDLPLKRSTGVAGDVGGTIYYAGGTISNTTFRGTPPSPGGEATPTPVPAPTLSPGPGPTATPKPGSTPAPTATAKPGTTPAPGAPTATPAAGNATPTPAPQAPLNEPVATVAPALPAASGKPGATPTLVGAQIKPKIVSTASRGYARFTTVIIDQLPAGASASVSCTGGKARGCPPGKAGWFQARKDGKLTLRGAILGRALRSGSSLQVLVTAPGETGRIERYRVGSKGRVTVVVRCLAPGAKQSTTCA